MNAGAVILATRLRWQQFLSLAGQLGAEVFLDDGRTEVIVYTGRDLVGAWVV